jgi:hypothetical protein
LIESHKNLVATNMATYEVITKFGVDLRVENFDLISRNFETIFSLDKSERLFVSQKELFVTHARKKVKRKVNRHS